MHRRFCICLQGPRVSGRPASAGGTKRFSRPSTIPNTPTGNSSRKSRPRWRRKLHRAETGRHAWCARCARAFGLDRHANCWEPALQGRQSCGTPSLTLALTLLAVSVPAQDTKIDSTTVVGPEGSCRRRARGQIIRQRDRGQTRRRIPGPLADADSLMSVGGRPSGQRRRVHFGARFENRHRGRRAARTLSIARAISTSS